MPSTWSVLDWKDIGPGFLLEDFLDSPTLAAVLTDARGAAGSLLAFRSETTHEVMMVTGGERYTIATWFHASHAGNAGGY